MRGLVSPRLKSPPTLGCKIDWSNQLTRNILCYYPVVEGFGDITHDIAYKNNTQSNSTIAWATTPNTPTVPRSLFFTLSGASGIRGPAFTSLPSGQPVTLYAMVNLSNSGGGFIDFITLTNGTQKIYLEAHGGNLYGGAYNGTTFYTGAGYALPQNVWHSVVFVLIPGTLGSNTSATFYLYVDGVLKQTASGKQTTTIANAYSIMGWANTAAIAGYVSNAAIWNRALSDTEVQQLYVDPYAMIAPRMSRALGVPISRLWILSLSESVSISDAISNKVQKVSTETFTLTDSRSQMITKLAAEVVQVIDVRSVSYSKVISETLVVSDALVRSVAKGLAEGLSISDSRTVFVTKQAIESLIIADGRSVMLAKTFAESIGVSDTVAMQLIIAGVMLILQMGSYVDDYSKEGGAA